MAKRKTAEGITLAKMAATLLEQKQVKDLLLMDLRGLSTLADWYLIGTCDSEPQMKGALSQTSKELSRQGIKTLGNEIFPGTKWAILDYTDVIIHLFEEKTREYFNLERLWADAKMIRLDTDNAEEIKSTAEKPVKKRASTIKEKKGKLTNPVISDDNDL